MKRALIGLVLWSGLASVTEAQIVGTCSPGLADAYLDIGNVRARVLNDGSLFYRGEPHVYRVPKGSPSNAIFASSFWIGGMVDGTLRMAASRYGPYEFWPGPLDEAGNPPLDCSEYDRIYRVSRAEVAAYEATGIAAPDLQDWPTGLGAPTVDVAGAELDLSVEPLASRRSRKIDLAAGERPSFVGDQMTWWIMNDVGNTHASSEGQPNGVEVQVTAFAFDEPGHVGLATFYRYTVIKRGDKPLTDAYVSMYVDPDLGDFGDDWMGSDSLLSLGYVWNSDNLDGGNEGYGSPPPALGYDIFQGPIVPSPGAMARVGSRLISGFRNLPLTAFMDYHSGEFAPPTLAAEYYNFMRARWRDGQPLTYGGNGRDFSDTPTPFMFSGDAANCGYWTECNTDQSGTKVPPGDRRFISSSGPFTIEPGGRQEILIGIVYARGSDNFDSVRELKAADEALQRFVDSGFTDWPAMPGGQPPTLIPPRLSPADGVTGQPIRMRLDWGCSDDAVYCQIAIDDNIDFVSPSSGVTAGAVVFELEANTTYWWRVRGIGRYEMPGPWSPPWTFTTGDTDFDASILDFSVVSNAAGPLEPPECGAIGLWDFPLVACRKDRPDGSRQQTGGVLAAGQGWVLHAGGANAYFGGPFDGASYIGRSFRGASAAQLGPFDYELRFTAAGGKAKRAFQGGEVIDVPFEFWRLGSRTPDNPADDVRLVPYINDMNTQFVFDIGGDHAVSSGSDDPLSDWIYGYLPDDDSPGQAGYDAFFAGSGDVSLELIARQVFVCVDCGPAAPYPQNYPEVGTVFRITTSAPDAPILAAPAVGAEVRAGDVRFFWSEPVTVKQELQIARTSDFTSLAHSLTEPQSGVTVSITEPGAYWWRVGTDGYGWSPVWTVTVLPATAVESESDLPTEYALDAIWPNPFNPLATIRFGLPVDAVATVDVVDVLGRRVAVIEAGARRAGGWHTVQFDGSRLSSGVYFVRLAAGGRLDVKSVVLLK